MTHIDADTKEFLQECNKALKAFYSGGEFWSDCIDMTGQGGEGMFYKRCYIFESLGVKACSRSKTRLGRAVFSLKDDFLKRAAVPDSRYALILERIKQTAKLYAPNDAYMANVYIAN